MSEVTITIDDHEVRDLLRRSPGNIRKAMRAAMGDSTALLLRDMKDYPPPPPNSTYKRTRTLGRSWSRVYDDERGFVGSNSNMAPYNRRVQDAEFQVRVHRGRWGTTQSVSKQRGPQIVRFFQDRLRQYVK